ncbi:MAG: hypothetical protein D6832_00835, partial [Alphaproteobacteria bacterium]
MRLGSWIRLGLLGTSLSLLASGQGGLVSAALRSAGADPEALAPLLAERLAVIARTLQDARPPDAANAPGKGTPPAPTARAGAGPAAPEAASPAPSPRFRTARARPAP